MKHFVLALVVMFAVGCVSAPDVQMVDKVTVDGQNVFIGMSSERVQSLIGDPDEVKSRNVYQSYWELKSKAITDQNKVISQWIYLRGDRSYSFHIDEGVVSKIFIETRNE